MNVRWLLFDLSRLTIASFLLWLMLDALRPGLVSHWWNLNYHFLTMIILLLITLKWSVPAIEQKRPSVFLNWLVCIFSAVIVCFFTKDLGLAALFFGLFTFLSIYLLTYEAYD